MSAESQSHYQVRYDEGARGAAAIGADADVVIIADGFPALPGETPLDATAVPGAAAVIRTTLAGASAAAAWALQLQVDLGRRAMIAVVAAGAETADGSARSAVEDALVAGAVVDELAALGIDFSSPEAAVACAGYAGLRRAVGHLSTASVTARRAAELGVELPALAAGDAAVEVLREHPER